MALQMRTKALRRRFRRQRLPAVPLFLLLLAAYKIQTAPINFAATAQAAPAQPTALVNEEHNPEVGNYLSCVIARKETTSLVDEEHNPEVGNYLSCIIA
ncbi:hypothetical protein JCM8202v2_005728 [Rhodotorula sphaerocarpa]